jgi:hypothetical protein
MPPRRGLLKKKDDGEEEKKVKKAPEPVEEEAANHKFEFPISALLAGGPPTDEHDSPSWTIHFKGIPDLESTGIKFTGFTSSERTTGQMVTEVLARRGVNAAIFAWLKDPKDLPTTLTVNDSDDNLIEKWEMSCRPVAVAVGELEDESGGPWRTTIQVSFSDLKIT